MNIKDFKWTEKRFGTTFANILKKLGGLSKDGTDGSIEYKDDDGNVSKLVTDSTFSSLLAKNGLIEVKWQELKDKRDNGELIPGSLYRITDYQCTTTQENTKSAGHQFDIVLLALSENKLSEEGWAMMHDNIYDITFSDGTKKVYLYYNDGDDSYNMIDIETLLGAVIDETDISINEETKTAQVDSAMYEFDEPNLTYNYFQNSNLSAWKVWYCLDNDKSKFAWADDRNDVSTKECINESLYRNKNLDTEVRGTNYYGWGSGNFSRYTTSEHPEIGDAIYKRGLSIGAPSFTANGTVEIYSPEYNGKSTKECIDVHIIKGLDGLNVDQIQNGVEKIKEPNPSTIVMDDITYYIWGIDGSGTVGTLNRIPKEGDIVYIPMPVGATPGQYVMTDVGRVIKYHPEYNIEKGRGVIYRLIDEFNNDVAYDFKNIQFFRKLDNNGHVTNEGTEKWIFTFSLYNIEDDELLDASLNYPKFVTDEGGWHITSNNKICRIYSYDDGGEPLYDTGVNRQCLNDTVFTFVAINYDRAPSIRNNVILTAYNCSFPDVNNLVLLWSVNRNYTTYTSSLDNGIIWDDKRCTFGPLS